MANEELSDEIKKQLNGQVALIERGVISFVQKLEAAKAAGAIGAVVYNNQPGKPLAMGGDKRVEIPAIMVSQALGQKLKQEMTLGNVEIQFKTDELIQEPDVIDTITAFSSKGPRIEDNLFKPEIAAPGQQIISAAMGKGDETVRMDGTSMAAPHMAGAMALIKQANPKLSVSELKALSMGTSKTLPNIPMTLQGAGRVQLEQALKSPIGTDTSAISLGRMDLARTQVVEKTIWVTNLTQVAQSLRLSAESNPGLQVTLPSTLELAAGGSAPLHITFTLDSKNLSEDEVEELNARIEFKVGESAVYQISALALRRQASEVVAKIGGSGNLELFNSGAQPGLAIPFNLLGRDGAKSSSSPSQDWRSKTCDLESAGYRILDVDSPTGKLRVLQVAFKIYSPLNFWLFCEPSILIDGNGDLDADQEIAGATPMSLEGVGDIPSGFFSTVINAHKAREIRQAYESAIASGDLEATLNYKPALEFVGPMAPFPHSTVAIIQVPVEKVQLGEDKLIHFRLATLGKVGDMVEADDYLAGSELGNWMSLSPLPEQQGYIDLPEDITVNQGSNSVELKRGLGGQPLVLYYPNNVWKPVAGDGQSQIL